MSFKGPLDYIDVASRIVEFRTKHPEGSLQQVSLDFREVNSAWWVIYTAAAYRTPDDGRPGIGTAWEPIPGRTNFTRDSEVQNAETAAWGRAIVAALAADTKKGIASAEEVRNRQADREEPVPEPTEADKLRAQIKNYCDTAGIEPSEIAQDFRKEHSEDIRTASVENLRTYLLALTGDGA